MYLYSMMVSSRWNRIETTNSSSSALTTTTGHHRQPEKELVRRKAVKAVGISTSSPAQIQLHLFWIATTLSKMRFGVILGIFLTAVPKGKGFMGVVYSSTLDIKNRRRCHHHHHHLQITIISVVRMLLKLQLNMWKLIAQRDCQRQKQKERRGIPSFKRFSAIVFYRHNEREVVVLKETQQLSSRCNIQSLPLITSLAEITA